jgi:hypothetical protein
VVVHVAAFLKDHQNVLETLARRSDMELMEIGPDGVRLYRLKR